MVYGYRVENQVGKHGLWRDFDGTLNPVFKHLTQGKCKDMPMEDSETYREGGKQWFASAPSKETLKHWFSEQDVVELLTLGYKVYEFKLQNTRQISPFEIVFTRDNIIEQKEIDYKEIWND